MEIKISGTSLYKGEGPPFCQWRSAIAATSLRFDHNFLLKYNSVINYNKNINMFQKWFKFANQNSDKIYVALGQLAILVAVIWVVVYSILQISTWRGFQFDPFLTIALVYIIYQQNKVLKSIQLQNQKNIEILGKLVEPKAKNILALKGGGKRK
jgi:hypothetical protein